jgi:hypothetical protein
MKMAYKHEKINTALLTMKVLIKPVKFAHVYQINGDNMITPKNVSEGEIELLLVRVQVAQKFRKPYI